MKTTNENTEPQVLILGSYEADVQAQVNKLASLDYVARFWNKDPELWGGGDRTENIKNSLGWTTVVSDIRPHVAELKAFADGIREAGFTRVVLCGMGGSSLAPLVLSSCLPRGENSLPLTVLDSTDPETVLGVKNGGHLDTTLFIVASKSGSTAEPNAFYKYFYEKTRKPENFVAITDPGSPFEAEATKAGFRKIWLNYKDIGGRFSALSFFGMVPAALLGLDIEKILDRAQAVIDENGPSVPAMKAPAVILGAAMGVLANAGTNKLTFLTPNHLVPLGLWLEQLVAESTGKEQKGILPIADEESGPPSVYGNDRFFVIVRDSGHDCSFLDIRESALRETGHPIAIVNVSDPYDIATEFMRFEIATAVAGTVLGINPFDQPNVEEAKIITRALLDEFEKNGSLPLEDPKFVEDGIAFFGDSACESSIETFKKFFDEAGPGSFVTIQAYLPETLELSEKLHHLQATLRDQLKFASTCGYGPRFLHSTGQFHKGGPNQGLFIQLTGEHPVDACIPLKLDHPLPEKVVMQKAKWGDFIDAQAMGDLETLKRNHRRTLRIHLPANRIPAIDSLIQSVCEATSHRTQ